MAFILSVVEKVSLSIQPIDAKGNAAPVDGVPVWSVANPDLAALAVSDDGLSALLTATAPGSTQVSVQADARLGPDVNTITGLLDVVITPAEATTIQIVAGKPEPQ